MNNEQIIKDTAEYNFNLGFQKGKLEQKKEELEFLDDCFRVYRGEKYIQSDSISKLIERIKQLQKEINSQTENEVLIAENSISDKEVAQPYSKSDKTTKEIRRTQEYDIK